LQIPPQLLNTMSNRLSLSIGPDSFQIEPIIGQIDTSSQQACHK
jgi:hypothetical protein